VAPFYDLFDFFDIKKKRVFNEVKQRYLNRGVNFFGFFVFRFLALLPVKKHTPGQNYSRTFFKHK